MNRIRMGAHLRSLREQRGLSLRAVAAQTGINFSYIGQIEHGKRNASVATLGMLAECYRVPTWQVIQAGEKAT